MVGTKRKPKAAAPSEYKPNDREREALDRMRARVNLIGGLPGRMGALPASYAALGGPQNMGAGDKRRRALSGPLGRYGGGNGLECCRHIWSRGARVCLVRR